MARRTRRPVRAMIAALAAASMVATLAAPVTAKDKRIVTVMTRNLYLGTDLNPIIAAPDLPSLLLAVDAAWNQVVASFPADRLAAVADEIAAHEPDLVGLQEVSLWRTDVPADGPATPATTVVFDFLTMLLDELAARGLAYEPVAVSSNFDAEVPAGLPPAMDVRLTDRDVILARSDAKTSQLKLSNPMNALFAASFPIPTPGGVLQGVRGWTSVDVKVRGSSFRLINTHLETQAVAAAQIGQALEMLAVPANTSLPVLAIGDFNSPADGSGTPTYGIIAGAGFADVWPAAVPGDTCCQAADLRNAASLLDERIDIIFARGGFEVLSVDRVGEDPADITLSGVWPSDHAGVVATVRLPSPDRIRR